MNPGFICSSCIHLGLQGWGAVNHLHPANHHFSADQQPIIALKPIANVLPTNIFQKNTSQSSSLSQSPVNHQPQPSARNRAAATR
jgi:hypothetical protein